LGSSKTTCYYDFEEKTCQQYGYVDTCPDGQSGTKVTGVHLGYNTNATCYKDCIDDKCDENNYWFEDHSSNEVNYEKRGNCYKATSCNSSLGYCASASDIPSGFKANTNYVHYVLKPGDTYPTGVFSCFGSYCPSGYTESNGASDYFEYAYPISTSTCVANNKTLTCYKVLCKNDVDTSVFTSTSRSVAGKECLKATGCTSAYTSSSGGKLVAESNGIKCYTKEEDKCWFKLSITEPDLFSQGTRNYSTTIYVSSDDHGVDWRNGSIVVGVDTVYYCPNAEYPRERSGKSIKISYQGKRTSGTLSISSSDIDKVCESSGGWLSNIPNPYISSNGQSNYCEQK
ncbi:MAG: hypothetical protein NC218_10955, partial [Acetobacter sp.]|nr:hypothetical protein [Acetobacter sp.]